MLDAAAAAARGTCTTADCLQQQRGQMESWIDAGAVPVSTTAAACSSPSSSSSSCQPTHLSACRIINNHYGPRTAAIIALPCTGWGHNLRSNGPTDKVMQGSAAPQMSRKMALASMCIMSSHNPTTAHIHKQSLYWHNMYLQHIPTPWQYKCLR